MVKQVNKQINKKLLDKFFLRLAQKMSKLQHIEKLNRKQKNQIIHDALFTLPSKERDLLIKTLYQKNVDTNGQLMGGAFSFSDITDWFKNTASTVGKYASNIFSALTEGIRKNAPPSFREFLSNFGHLQMQSIRACRNPLMDFGSFALGIASGLKWYEEMKKLNYDNMFHVFFVITLAGGRKARLEKNEVLSIKWFDGNEPSVPQSTNPGEEPQQKPGCIDIPPIANMPTLQEFINNAHKHVGDAMFMYNGKNNNCQIFLKNLLRYNGMLTQEFEDFIMQDTETLVGNLPTVTQGFMNTVTDVAGLWDVVLHGRGVKQKNKHKLMRYKL